MAVILEYTAPVWTPAGVVALLLVLLAGVVIFEWVFLTVPFPPGMPLVREPEGARRFSWKTRLAYYTDCERLYNEAYENVCQPWQ